MILDLPDDLFRSARWSLSRPAQVNTSEWTGRRQVMGLPGGARWACQLEHVPIIGEGAVRKWRAFQAKAKGVIVPFRVPATETSQDSVSFYPLAPSVSPASGMNVTKIGRTATRTGGADSWGTAELYSTEVTGGARLSFRASQTNKALMVALNTEISGASGYTHLAFALYPRDDGQLGIFEGGANRGLFGGYSTRDILSVDYVDDGSASRVEYFRNDELLRRVTTAAGQGMIFDSQFYDVGAAINHLAFGGQSSVSAGQNVIDLTGIPASTTPLRAGMLGTMLFLGGGSQLVILTADLAADVSGDATARFEATLRGKPFCLVTGDPWGLMAFDDPAQGWSVDPGQLYAVAVGASEAF